MKLTVPAGVVLTTIGFLALWLFTSTREISLCRACAVEIEQVRHFGLFATGEIIRTPFADFLHREGIAPGGHEHRWSGISIGRVYGRPTPSGIGIPARRWSRGEAEAFQSFLLFIKEAGGTELAARWLNFVFDPAHMQAVRLCRFDENRFDDEGALGQWLSELGRVSREYDGAQFSELKLLSAATSRRTADVNPGRGTQPGTVHLNGMVSLLGTEFLHWRESDPRDYPGTYMADISGDTSARLCLQVDAAGDGEKFVATAVYEQGQMVGCGDCHSDDDGRQHHRLLFNPGDTSFESGELKMFMVRLGQRKGIIVEGSFLDVSSEFSQCIR
jgi:hypothetical protein